MWDLFEQQYGWKAVQAFPHPNLGFQGGTCENIEPLRRELSRWVSRREAFEIAVDGAGYFEAPSRVIFLRVILTPELEQFHRELHEVLGRHCTDLSALYEPGQWVPHVTLAMGDVDLGALTRVREDLRDYHPRFLQAIRELSLAARRPERGGIEILESWRLSDAGVASDELDS
jgi:2'-5' RNA ligase